MRKFLRRFFCALLSLVLVAAVSTAIAVPAVIRSRGDLSDYMVSEEFQESIGKANAKRAKDTSARIMSANLLVHYESWGGTDAHKRAKMFLQVLDTYRGHGGIHRAAGGSCGAVGLATGGGLQKAAGRKKPSHRRERLILSKK